MARGDECMGESLIEQRLGDGSPAFFKSASAYGKARGVSRTTAGKWVRDGLIVFVPRPGGGKDLVDAAASDARREADQNPLKRAAPSAAKAISPAEPVHVELPTADPAAATGKAPALDDPYKRSAAEAVSRDKWLSVRLREIQVREKMGELGRVDDMRNAVFLALRRTRDTIQRIGADVCERANPDDPTMARRVIDEEVDKKMAALGIQIEAILMQQVAGTDPDEGLEPALEPELEDGPGDDLDDEPAGQDVEHA